MYCVLSIESGNQFPEWDLVFEPRGASHRFIGQRL